jgi:hypothetical protein
VNGRPSAEERVRRGEGVLTRTDLRELGWERRGVDAIFAAAPVISLEGYSRPVIRVRDYLRVIDGATVCDRCASEVR